MPVIRSSVRPVSSKLPWGTILEPEYGLGHQRMTSYELNQTVSRLSQAKDPPQHYYDPPKQTTLNKAGIEAMVERLTENAETKAVDSNRTQKNSMYKDMGVVNSYAWKGYN